MKCLTELTQLLRLRSNRACVAWGLALLLSLSGCGGGSWFGWNAFGPTPEEKVLAKKRKQFPTDIPLARDVGLDPAR